MNKKISAMIKAIIKGKWKPYKLELNKATLLNSSYMLIFSLEVLNVMPVISLLKRGIRKSRQVFRTSNILRDEP